MRLASCCGVGLDIIEPCGFLLEDRRLKRVGMDYLQWLDWERHSSWPAFRAARIGNKLILLTTAGDTVFPHIGFGTYDVLLFGRESAGVPPEVHEAADVRLRIPMRAPARSLNIAMSAALVLGEALRQTAGWPAAD